MIRTFYHTFKNFTFGGVIMKKKIKAILLSLLLAAALVGGSYLYFQTRVTTHAETFSSSITESVAQILQLSTLEYNYTDVLSHKESSKFKDLTIPFTEKRFMIKYTGYIKAGSDLSNIEIDTPDPETIHVTINHATITDNVINEEDIYVYDEKGSAFNQLKIADVYEIMVDEKEKTQELLIGKGFLEEADQRSKDLMTELLKAMNFQNIVIRFNPAK